MSGERFPTRLDLGAACVGAAAGLVALSPIVGLLCWQAIQSPALDAASGPALGPFWTALRVAMGALVVLVGAGLARDGWLGRFGRRTIDPRTRAWIVVVALVLGAALGAAPVVALGPWLAPAPLVGAAALGLASARALKTPARAVRAGAGALFLGSLTSVVLAAMATEIAQAALRRGPTAFVLVVSIGLADTLLLARRAVEAATLGEPEGVPAG